MKPIKNFDSPKNIHEQLSPRVQRLRGIVKMEDGADYKMILEEELVKKYDAKVM